MSISGLRRTSSRERGRLRWSLRIKGISGRIGTITTDIGDILQGILDLLLLRLSILCFESQYTKFWKKIKNES